MGVDDLAEISSTGTEQYTSTSRLKSGPTISGLRNEVHRRLSTCNTHALYIQRELWLAYKST